MSLTQPLPKPRPLAKEQLDQFRTEGYVLLGAVLDRRALEQLREQEARLREVKLRWDPSLATQTVFISQVCHYAEPVRHCCVAGPHVPLVQQLIGPDVALWFNQFVTKNPDGDSGRSEFPWHQDNGYVAVDPPTNVTVWIALDDVDQHNGCVWVMPRSHERGLLDHRKKSEDNWHLTVPVEGDGVPVPLKAGEAVAFTGLTLHRSKLNHGSRPRRAFFIEYAQADARCARPDEPWQPLTSHPNTWIVSGAAPLPDDF